MQEGGVRLQGTSKNPKDPLGAGGTRTHPKGGTQGNPNTKQKRKNKKKRPQKLRTKGKKEQHKQKEQKEKEEEKAPASFRVTVVAAFSRAYLMQIQGPGQAGRKCRGVIASKIDPSCQVEVGQGACIRRHQIRVAGRTERGQRVIQVW